MASHGLAREALANCEIGIPPETIRTFKRTGHAGAGGSSLSPTKEAILHLAAVGVRHDTAQEP